LLSNRKCWPPASAFRKDGSKLLVPHSLAWLLRAIIATGVVTADIVLSTVRWRLDGHKLCVAPAVALAHQQPAVDLRISVELLTNWVCFLSDDHLAQLLPLFPQRCISFEPSEAYEILAYSMPQAADCGRISDFGFAIVSRMEDHGLRCGNLGLECLFTYNCFNNDVVLLCDEMIELQLSYSKFVSCANLGVAALESIASIYQTPAGLRRFSFASDEDVINQCTAHAAGLLRTLQSTLALLGSKLSIGSKHKLPLLLRGNGKKTLAQMAKETFGDLLVEHPTYAHLFDEARFQADVESMMADPPRWFSGALSAESIARRVNALRQEKTWRVVYKKERQQEADEWDGV
jgi:hypothetical protein